MIFQRLLTKCSLDGAKSGNDGGGGSDVECGLRTGRKLTGCSRFMMATGTHASLPISWQGEHACWLDTHTHRYTQRRKREHIFDTFSTLRETIYVQRCVDAIVSRASACVFTMMMFFFFAVSLCSSLVYDFRDERSESFCHFGFLGKFKLTSLPAYWKSFPFPELIVINYVGIGWIRCVELRITLLFHIRWFGGRVDYNNSITTRIVKCSLVLRPFSAQFNRSISLHGCKPNKTCGVNNIAYVLKAICVFFFSRINSLCFQVC